MSRARPPKISQCGSPLLGVLSILYIMAFIACKKAVLRTVDLHHWLVVALKKKVKVKLIPYS